MSNGVPINKAARELKKSPSTIRRWIQRGCPCVSPGEVGRNKGAVLNLDDVMRWRGGGVAPANNDELLSRLAVALLDTIRRDEAYISVGISERETAEILVLVYQRYYRNLTLEQVDINTLPPEMKHLCAILL